MSEKGGWSSVPNWVIRDAPLDNAEKILFIALLNRANDKGESWPSLTTLAKDTGLSESTVKRRLRKLEEVGLITRQRRVNQDGKQISNIYQVNPFRPGQGDPAALVTVTGGGGHSDPRSTTQRSTTHIGRRKPETTLPEDWKPNQSAIEFARANGIDLAHEFNQFTSHAIANDRRLRSWDAGFRMWLGNAKKWTTPQQQALTDRSRVITDYDD